MQRGGCIAVYDEIYGSLRLTERLFLEFDHVLARLKEAVDSEEYLKNTVEKIQGEVSTFTDGSGSDETGGDIPTGYEYVFTRHSRVCYQQAGAMAIDVEVIDVAIIEGILMYRILVPRKAGQKATKKWINKSFIEPSADATAWERALWNRETEEYENSPDGGA